MNNDKELEDWIHQKVIYQSGVDYEGRPMLVLSACHFPDPAKVDYDLFYQHIVTKLEKFVESDYVLILFAGAISYKPSWGWIYRAYQGLSRKYKKNLKKLYVVHPAMWFRVMMGMLSALISPKFYSKVVWTWTLSDLAGNVPLRQVRIPDAVFCHNLQFESKIDYQSRQRADGTRPKMFGIPLIRIMGQFGEFGLPLAIVDAATYLRKKERLASEGLFRKSPNAADLQEVRDAYDAGEKVSLEAFNDEHLAAGIIKLFLRELPEALFPSLLYPLIKELPDSTTMPPLEHPDSQEQISFITQTIFPKLERCKLVLFRYICQLLADMTPFSERNRMNPSTLSTLLSPNLIRGSDPLEDITMCGATPGKGQTVGNLLRICITSHDLIFTEPMTPVDGVSGDPGGDDSPNRRATTAAVPSDLARYRQYMMERSGESLLGGDGKVEKIRKKRRQPKKKALSLDISNVSPFWLSFVNAATTSEDPVIREVSSMPGSPK